MDRQKLLTEIMDAKTREELERVAEGITACLAPAEAGGSVSHLTVRKAIGLIRKYYQDGITLDEISRRLRVTPEYLGTLFHREVGMSFSTYIRNVRIDKAKELLCGTQLKLYEIEERFRATKLFRCSKSMILNIGKIRSVAASVNGRFEAKLINGETVIISRQYVPDLKKRLGM